MSDCLCCGKPLKGTGEGGWHASCVKKFFSTGKLPVISIDRARLEQLAKESAGRGLTVPGVQKKLSLHLAADGRNPRLTLVNYPTGYILKPPVEDFENMPRAEQAVMLMADAAGISTVPHRLILQDGRAAYITKRVDRVISKTDIKMLAMEDFCQLSGRLTRDKYKGSYERCADIIRRWSSRPGLDMTEMFMRLVFCFITGNSDMHLKNFSLIETASGTGQYVLSPAYDLLPVNLLMPEDTEQCALTLNGKKRNLRRKDFLAFAQSRGIEKAVADRLINRLAGKKQTFTDICRRSLISDEQKENLCRLIEYRCAVLAGQIK